MASTSVRAVLFDLDNTLFDHHHSQRSAMMAVQRANSDLWRFTLSELVDLYNSDLEASYDQDLSGKFWADNPNVKKVRHFFAQARLERPTTTQVEQFRAIYKPAYHNAGRATPGSIETLVRLREHGFRIGIVTNGKTHDQTTKARDIGVLPLVDAIVTAEETGSHKPDRGIFDKALELLGSDASSSIMVGGSPLCDIEGARNANIEAIFYRPASQEPHLNALGGSVRIVSHMRQILARFEIPGEDIAPVS